MTTPTEVAGARWIRLTQGRFTLVDEADYERIAAHRWFYAQGYARRTLNAPRRSLDGPKSRQLHMHREVLSAPPELQVDHINGDKLDNRRLNLRLATNAENCRNRGASSANTSGAVGVSFHKGTGKWRAVIHVNGRTRSLGLHVTVQAASLAYQEAARQLFGAFHSNGGGVSQ